MNADDMHDLAPLYVVDALTPDETREFDIHLADCDECKREVADMRRVTDALAESVQTDPPASLRSAVLASIASTAQEAPAGAPTRVPVGVPVEAVDPHAAGAVPVESAADGDVPDNVVELRRPWTSRVPRLLAAAAVIFAVGFGGWALQSRHDAQQASSQQAELISLLGASDVRTVSSSVPGGGSGTVVLSSSRDQAVFVTAGMPALPSSKVYELWTITDKAVPAGTFTGGDGSVVHLPDAALSAQQIAVTVEPSGGSTTPTTPPVMAVNVPPGS